MLEKDEYAGLIAFLFTQDRKDCSPPRDLVSKVLAEAKKKAFPSIQA